MKEDLREDLWEKVRRRRSTREVFSEKVRRRRSAGEGPREKVRYHGGEGPREKRDVDGRGPVGKRVVTGKVALIPCEEKNKSLIFIINKGGNIHIYTPSVRANKGNKVRV